MEKKYLLKFCRYYKGEKGNPFVDKDQDKALLWDYERAWLNTNFSDNGHESLAEYISEYSHAGLSLFEIQDDTPASLKALLFNRYAKSSFSINDAVEPFKKFYQKYYK